MTIRAAARICRFVFEITLVILNYFFAVTFAHSKNRRAARADWLHRGSARVLKIFNCTTAVTGPIPKTGLLISNHLSYLDILLISAITPAVFVSKAEVRKWVVVGWLAEHAGTVFVERDRRTHVGEVNREIESTLADEVLVVVFPEGTSTSGYEILPFRSPLLEPAAGGKQPIAVSYLHYELDDGDAHSEVCYWGDHTFFPHLMHLLGKRGVRATVRFGTFQRKTNDRKEMARQLREAVLQLKSEG
ncbi:MAG: lysophospholipid acyltransferase family protein [Verrucomicrobiota bacterium]|jgi:1-acyl-sn-glycerol-3-phosphate acyltransferase